MQSAIIISVVMHTMHCCSMTFPNKNDTDFDDYLSAAP